VFRALNLNNGQTVAVKRIPLTGLSDSEIDELMKEVDLLKQLSHPGIVKYEGMTRDRDTLSIVLE
jgi:serine/threonine protein kinase